MYVLTDQLLYNATNFLYFLTVLKIPVSYKESKKYSKLILPVHQNDWSIINELLHLPIESRKSYLEQLELNEMKMESLDRSF
jgi:hypothetical protein